MLHRQRVERESLYKGPKIVHNLLKPLTDRLKSRHVVGPYIIKPPAAGEDNHRFFYLESDFCPDLRYQWCDEITSSIQHTGWFIDDIQSDKIRGIVLRLNHGRGFLAGWSMGAGMASVLSVDIYDDELSAAYAADSMAEYAAEAELENHLTQNAA